MTNSTGMYSLFNMCLYLNTSDCVAVIDYRSHTECQTQIFSAEPKTLKHFLTFCTDKSTTFLKGNTFLNPADFHEPPIIDLTSSKSSGVSTPRESSSLMVTRMAKPFSSARSCSSFSIFSSSPCGKFLKTSRKLTE